MRPKLQASLSATFKPSGSVPHLTSRLFQESHLPWCLPHLLLPRQLHPHQLSSLISAIFISTLAISSGSMALR